MRGGGGSNNSWRRRAARTGVAALEEADEDVDRVAVEGLLPLGRQPHADDLVGEVHQVEVEAVLREALLVLRDEVAREPCGHREREKLSAAR